jgi:hypothetical protein
LQVFDFVQAKFAILMDFGFFLMTARAAEMPVVLVQRQGLGEDEKRTTALIG